MSLRYLYYLDQVGLSVSPMSNDFLFLRIKDSPFKSFHANGLNVTLSTDDPLQFHLSLEPLLEEYTVARAAWSLSMTDLCEIAANSLRQSDFPAAFKEKWHGTAHGQQGPRRNDGDRTNVPTVREQFRWGMLERERAFVRGCAPAGCSPPDGRRTEPGAAADHSAPKAPVGKGTSF